jgi:ribosomal protein S18 acetylase RimI-like enzyme
MQEAENNMRNIREVRKTDLDRIREIVSTGLRKCVLESEEHFDFLYTEICNILDNLSEDKDSSLFWVIEQNNFILGVISIQKYWNISTMFIDPEYHRSGIGRELLTQAIDYCKDRSPKGCLMLNSSNHAAPFYRKMGFTQTGNPRDLPGGCIPFEYQYKNEIYG